MIIVKKIIAWGTIVIIVLLAIIAAGLVIEISILERSLKRSRNLETEQFRQSVSSLRANMNQKLKERYNERLQAFENCAQSLSAEKKKAKELEGKLNK